MTVKDTSPRSAELTDSTPCILFVCSYWQATQQSTRMDPHGNEGVRGACYSNRKIANLIADSELVGAYPFGWIWPQEESDLIKCLIPFFDGLAIFMPEELVDQIIDRDPYLMRPLFECGYLRNINPDNTLDKDLSNRILKMLNRFIKDERYVLAEDNYPHVQRSMRHLGYRANQEAVVDFLKDLERFGLLSAREHQTFATQSYLCTAIVQNCFSALSRKVRDYGTELVPVRVGNYAYDRILLWDQVASFVSDIFKFEIEDVGIDLRQVPLDEIFDFASRYRSEYQAYLRSIREVARDLHDVHDMDEINRVARDRLETLHDQKEFLQRSSRSEFRRRSLSLIVGVASSAWTARSGDAVAAALATAATAVGLAPSSQQPSEYSYLFRLSGIRRRKNLRS